jgi:hypothetical protein
VKQQVVSEKSQVNRIMAKLRTIRGIVVRKRHGTAMGVAGDPDLYGSYRGRHFEIEVKRPNDPRAVLTKLQAERLREWNVDGNAIVGVARTPEEALAILGLLKPDPWFGSAVDADSIAGRATTRRRVARNAGTSISSGRHPMFARSHGPKLVFIGNEEILEKLALNYFDPAPESARKPNADEQAGDAGDDWEPES